MSGDFSTDYPCYSPGVNNFADDVIYEVESEKYGNDQVILVQKLQGKSFLRDLLVAGDAEFILTAVYGNSPFRCFHRAEQSEKDGNLLGSHKFTSKLKDPPKLIPSIVSNVKRTYSDCVPSDLGLDDIWEGATFTIEKNNRLALGKEVRFTDQTMAVFQVKCDEALRLGCFHVLHHLGSGQLYDPQFTVVCSEDLYTLLKGAEGKLDDQSVGPKTCLAKAIWAHVLSTAYWQLRFPDESELEPYEPRDGILKEFYESLRATYKSTWCDAGFDPCKAATRVKPIHIFSSEPK